MMAKASVLRWPGLLKGWKTNKFKALANVVLYNQKMDLVVSSPSSDRLYIRPAPRHVEAFVEMITHWHEICYDTYRNRNFEPVDDVSITFLYNGTIYRGMFPYFNEPCENGFFQFKLRGTFVI
jgi:hypothetical protein